MADVLLLRPGSDRLASRRKYVPDLGIGFLMSALERAGRKATFTDLNAPRTADDALARLCRGPSLSSMFKSLLSVFAPRRAWPAGVARTGA